VIQGFILKVLEAGPDGYRDEPDQDKKLWRKIEFRFLHKKDFGRFRIIKVVVT
jgi:hypothetical protein